MIPGMTRVVSRSPNNSFRPRNSIRAYAYAAREAMMTMKTVKAVATMKLLKNQRATGSVGSLKIDVKLSSVGAFGMKFGVSHSLNGLIAVIAIQTLGSAKNTANRINRP